MSGLLPRWVHAGGSSIAEHHAFQQSCFSLCNAACCLCKHAILSPWSNFISLFSNMVDHALEAHASTHVHIYCSWIWCAVLGLLSWSRCVQSLSRNSVTQNRDEIRHSMLFWATFLDRIYTHLDHERSPSISFPPRIHSVPVDSSDESSRQEMQIHCLIELSERKRWMCAGGAAKRQGLASLVGQWPQLRTLDQAWLRRR